MNDKGRKGLCVAAAVGGALVATGVALSPAWAEQEVLVTGQMRPTRMVMIADLDLSSHQGRATLQSRVNGAVRSLCGAPSASELVREVWRRDCRETAYESARPQIDQAIRDVRIAEQMRAIRVAAR